MDPRLLAYLLFALVAAAVAAIVAFRLYHSPDRAYLRRLRREELSYRRRMAEQER